MVLLKATAFLLVVVITSSGSYEVTHQQVEIEIEFYDVMQDCINAKSHIENQEWYNDFELECEWLSSI